MVGPARGAAVLLCEQREVGIVVDVDGQPDALFHHVAERDVVERQMDALDRDAALDVDERGDAEADGARVWRVGTSFLDRLDHRVDHLVAIAAAPLPADPARDLQIRVDSAAEELRATRIESDHRSAGHARTLYRHGCVRSGTPAL